MEKEDYADNMMVMEFIKLNKLAQKDFANVIGVTPQMISAIKKRKTPITKDMIIYIINEAPELARKYGFLKDQKEFNNTSNNSKNEQMKSILTQLEFLTRNFMSLEDEVKCLKLELQELKSSTKQTEKSA